MNDKQHIFTVDLEDWLQSSLALMPAGWVKPGMDQPNGQFQDCTGRLLDLLDQTNATATFFVLSSLAEKYPGAIKAIRARGHEIASHGHGHELVYKLTPASFKCDLLKSRGILEGITGEKVKGYRAPYFSITQKSIWALDVLQELGFEYDASIFPISRGLYGIPGWQAFPHKLKDKFWEFPASTVSLMGKNIPVAGGGYLRLFPYGFTKWGIEQINRSGQSAVLYLHPYELDAESLRNPLPNETFRVAMVRWSQNLKRNTVVNKLSTLLNTYRFSSIRDWLKAR